MLLIYHIKLLNFISMVYFFWKTFPFVKLACKISCFIIYIGDDFINLWKLKSSKFKCLNFKSRSSLRTMHFHLYTIVNCDYFNHPRSYMIYAFSKRILSPKSLLTAIDCGTAWNYFYFLPIFVFTFTRCTCMTDLLWLRKSKVVLKTLKWTHSFLNQLSF